MKAWLRALRVHQWAKNGLLFVPAVAAHLAPTPEVVGTLFLAFAAFSLLASAVYVCNDLADRRADCAHPTKRSRPIAAGDISPAAAVVAAVVLTGVALLLATQLPRPFLLVWVAYLALGTAYSLFLKRAIALDVVVLASLYVVRVVAGAAAVDVPLSRWFLAFGVFFFLSLALLKRFVETRGVGERGGENVGGRGYHAEDASVLRGLGTATATVSALVYCLYITADEARHLYTHPDVLWLGLPVLLYWLVRIWLLASRDTVHEDPILFALRDPVSYAVLGALITTVVVAM